MYESEFAYNTDYVFISSGVNDLSQYKCQAGRLFKYYIGEKLSLYRKRYPNTIFIFNSLLTTDNLTGRHTTSRNVTQYHVTSHNIT